MAEHLQPHPPAPAAQDLGLLPCLLPALPRQRGAAETQGARVSTGEHTHILDLFASKTVFNDLVLPIYMFLASACVTEINHWQRERARAAGERVLSAVVFTDMCSLLTVCYCSQGLLGPVSH